MNQKTKYTLRTCLGAAFAALLINPLASYAGTWSNQGGPNQWKYDLGDGSYAADGWYWIDSDQDGMEECYYFDKKASCWPEQELRTASRSIPMAAGL